MIKKSSLFDNNVFFELQFQSLHFILLFMRYSFLFMLTFSILVCAVCAVRACILFLCNSECIETDFWNAETLNWKVIFDIIMYMYV